jgi:hypothetical protein
MQTPLLHVYIILKLVAITIIKNKIKINKAYEVMEGTYCRIAWIITCANLSSIRALASEFNTSIISTWVVIIANLGIVLTDACSSVASLV